MEIYCHSLSISLPTQVDTICLFACCNVYNKKASLNVLFRFSELCVCSYQHSYLTATNSRCQTILKIIMGWMHLEWCCISYQDCPSPIMRYMYSTYQFPVSYKADSPLNPWSFIIFTYAKSGGGKKQAKHCCAHACLGQASNVQWDGQRTDRGAVSCLLST